MNADTSIRFAPVPGVEFKLMAPLSGFERTGCCSTSPDGSCYDDCCSDAWTVFCLPCRCATHLLCMPFVGRCVSEDAYSHVEKRVPKPVPPSVVLAQAAKRTKSAQAAAAAKAKALSAGRTRSKESPEWRRQPSAEEGGASAV